MRDWLFMLPVYHLALCFTFLLFYSLGFRSYIETFYSVSDVFTLSFREIAPGYLALALMVPIGIWFSSPLVQTRDKNGIEQAFNSPVYRIHTIVFVIATISLIITSLSLFAAYYVFTGLYSIAAISILLGGSVCLGFAIKATKKKMTALGSALLLVFFPLLVAAFSGARGAERDLTVDWESAKAEYPRCGEFAVLRTFGSRFLAVNKENIRVMLDEECEERFVFVSPVRGALGLSWTKARASGRSLLESQRANKENPATSKK